MKATRGLLEALLVIVIGLALVATVATSTSSASTALAPFSGAQALVIIVPLIFVVLIMFMAPVNGVSQYVGYLASQHNAGCGTCANPVNTSGDVAGLAVAAPFTGQLVQVSVYLDNVKPTAIVTATFPAGTSPTRTLDAGCLSLCGHVDAGQS